MRRLKGPVVIVAIALMLVAQVSLLRAQSTDPDALNITTSPLPISLTAKPTETVSTELRVKNSGNKTEILKVGLMKFTAFGEEGKPQLQDREAGDDYFDWVKFSETEFTAEPGEWKVLKMTVNVPVTAAFGYYYAVTFSRANPIVPTDERATAITGGTATLVLMDIQSPDAKRELKLNEFQVSKRTYEFLPAVFSVKLTNSGNVHVAPTGTIYIRRGSKQIDTIRVNDSKGNILPGSGRVFSASWTNGFPVYEVQEQNGAVVLDDGQPQQALSWKLSQLKNIRFGKYTAYLTLVYDDGKRDIPLEASIEFWVIPWRALLIIVGLPVLVLGIIIYLIISRRRYKNRALRFRK